MRILINALSARERGAQTYLKNLLSYLPEDGSIQVALLAPSSLELPVSNAAIVRHPVPRCLVNPFVRAAWEKLMIRRVARRFDADVLFCPGGVVTGAPRGCKVVTMFRNMIPFDERQRRRYPLGYERVRNWLLNRVMLKSMLRADLVIFISNYARQVIERQSRGKEVRGVVIPHGVAEQFRRLDGDVRGLDASWIEAGYFLYVSYIDFYKAQVEVVQAYAQLRKLRKIRLKLLLVGPENADYGRRVRDEVQRLGLGEDVVFTGALPYTELPRLYQHAFANIFASESENCPNILLEALASGRPVLSSSAPPMPEFAADAALYFEPRDPSDLARKLDGLLDDAQRMAELARRARERSDHFDWAVTARRTWDAIRGVTVRHAEGMPS